jgi:glutamyl aminopeptidase
MLFSTFSMACFLARAPAPASGYFTLNDRYLGRVPKSISSGFSTKLELEELKAFFAKYPDAGAGARARKQAIEKVENNIKWLENHEENIYSQLKTMKL